MCKMRIYQRKSFNDHLGWDCRNEVGVFCQFLFYSFRMIFESRSWLRQKDPKDALPHCPLCDGLMRPGTVWSDEKMNETIDKHIGKFAISLQCFRQSSRTFDFCSAEELAQQADLYIEIGVTPTVFPSKSYLPIIRKRKIPCAEFNTKTTPNSLDFT